MHVNLHVILHVIFLPAVPWFTPIITSLTLDMENSVNPDILAFCNYFLYTKKVYK
jgi:hypothetical protein